MSKEKMVKVTCAIDVFYRGKLRRQGEEIEVSPEDARAECFKTAETRKAEEQSEAERQAQIKQDSEDFMARARASGELRRRANLEKALAAEAQAKRQAAMAQEAQRTLTKDG